MLDIYQKQPDGRHTCCPAGTWGIGVLTIYRKYREIHPTILGSINQELADNPPGIQGFVGYRDQCYRAANNWQLA